MPSDNKNKPSRRSFLHNFFPEMFVLFQQARGHKMVPLNKLNTLPDDILVQIRPTLFQDEAWVINGNKLLKSTDKGQEAALIRVFKPSEECILDFFLDGVPLGEIVVLVAKKLDLNFALAHEKVFDLFFELCNSRVFYPQNLEELV